MLYNSKIPELVDRVHLDRIRVYAPTPLLFVCGGPSDIRVLTLQSLRDAFLHFADDEEFKAFKVLIAEKLNAFFPRGKYRDILRFEADLAQICDLIVLFSESYGSAAELGAFCMEPEIASRLLVFIDDENYNSESFIKLGPLRALENAYGDPAVYVLRLVDLNIPNIRSAEGVDVGWLKSQVLSGIDRRRKSYREHTSLDKKRAGHIIKFSVGLLQHYGSLTLEELKFQLECFGVNVSYDEVENYLLCAEFADWVVKTKIGSTSYFVSKVEKQAISYEFKSKELFLDKLRWQGDILSHWEKTDQNRYRAIQSARGPQ